MIKWLKDFSEKIYLKQFWFIYLIYLIGFVVIGFCAYIGLSDG